jgi:hypothetical protein
MVKITAKGLHTISFGTYTINISDLEQLVDIGQTRAIGDAIHYCCQYMNEQRTLKQIIEKTLAAIREKGFEILDRIPSGEYVLSRKFELAGAINRLRSIRMNQGGSFKQLKPRA